VKEQFKLENGKYVMPGPVEERLARSRYIKNIMLYGANRPHCVALVSIDEEAVQVWAAQQGLELGDLEEDPRVLSLLDEEIRLHGAGSRSYELPKRHVVTRRELTIEDGFLTPTLKLRRRAVVDAFGGRLEAAYEGGGAGAGRAEASP
jgi:long-chain acyl-CoA synthetase